MLEVSVVLPVYNGEKYISDAINSILTQKFDSFELIVVDDGSTDRTSEILNNYEDTRLRILTNTQNKGLVFSLNLAINNSSGQFICRMDADDICDEYRILKQYQFLIENPKINVVGCQGYNIDENGRVLNKKGWRKNRLLIDFYCLLGENPVGHPFSMIRKKCIFEISGYRELYFLAEDKDLWLRLFKSGSSFHNLTEILLYYRIHSGQVTDSKTRVQNVSRLVIKDFYTSIGVKSSFLEEISIEAFLDFSSYKIKNILFCFRFMHEILYRTRFNFIKRSILMAFYIMYFFKRVVSNTYRRK